MKLSYNDAVALATFTVEFKRFSNSMLPGPVKSEPRPAVMNGNEMCHVSCSCWCN